MCVSRRLVRAASSQGAARRDRGARGKMADERVLDERRRMCVAQRERASREIGEITRVRWAEASARGEQLGRGATRPWGARQDGRRGCSTSGDACASRNDERASREMGEITRVRVAAASARGEQLGRGALGGG